MSTFSFDFHLPFKYMFPTWKNNQLKQIVESFRLRSAGAYHYLTFKG